MLGEVERVLEAFFADEAPSADSAGALLGGELAAFGKPVRRVVSVLDAQRVLHPGQRPQQYLVEGNHVGLP